MRDYWFWLRAEYFVEHLPGVDQTAADITLIGLFGQDFEKVGQGDFDL